MLTSVMGLLNWVVGVLEVVATVPVAQKKVAELSIAILVGILVVLLVFYRHQILPNLVVWIQKICHPTLVATAKATTLSMEAIKVNDSVYQLHKPDGDPKLQVLFFHGLLFGDSSEMHLSTWQSDDGSNCIWPKTWLAEEFPDAQILVISYVEGLEEGSAERLHMHNISENLISDFMQAGIGQQPYCPVVLVGHSFGGLVIKELCLQAHNTSIGVNGGSNIKKFLDNLRGIFYYSTPHHGSPHIIKAEKLLKVPLFKYFRSLSTDAAVLNHRFHNLPTAFHQNLHVEGLGEGRKVQSGLFKGCVVVPEASARDGDKFNLESTADHFSICRPKDKTSRRFSYLTRLIQNIDDSMKEEKKKVDEIRLKEEAMALKRTIRQDLQEDVLNRKWMGIEIRLKEVKVRFQKFQTLGFTGMGGVGKSTLAKLVFNEECHAFEYTCFVNEVKSQGLQCDLKDLAWKHMHRNGKKVGKEDEWSDLRGKRLLLVLDDISGDRDITFLSSKVNICSAESRFIVTTRDCDKLSKSLEDVDINIYEVPFLDKNASNELFMMRAFANEQPMRELTSVMEEIVKKCDGLPLTLAVIGSYLRRGKKENIDAYVQRWRQTLNALDQAEQVTPMNEKLWAKLRLSYDTLADNEKEVFLDAATFFSATFEGDTSEDDTFEGSSRTGSWTLREAKAAWRKAYSTNYERCNEVLVWQTLVDRGLVYDVGEDERIKIHEQLLSLGRKIAAESIDKIRVWDQPRCPASKLLQITELQKKEFHALMLADDDTIPDHALPRLKKLRYLEANFFSHSFRKALPSELVLLKCHDLQLLQDFLPADLQGHLVVLRLSGVKFLPSFIGQFTSLRIFTSAWGQVSQIECGQIIPDEVGDLKQLEYLQLLHNDCGQRLPETFGNLSNLRHLRIDVCTKLDSLPKSFGCLASLEWLELFSCLSLSALPDSFGYLSALKRLVLENCELEALPDSFGDLCSLAHLEIKICGSLCNLSDGFGKLSRLKHLEIFGCHALTALPDSFGKLSALERLYLSACGFEALPDSFGDLRSLEDLWIGSCSDLCNLSDGFGKLSRLKYLKIFDCYMTPLPELFGNLSALERLDLQECGFRALPDSFGNLRSLAHLEIIDCPWFCSLSNGFGKLLRLKHLEILDCYGLTALPDSFGKLSALERLHLEVCRFEALPDSFGDLRSLAHLVIKDCYYLCNLSDGFGKLSSLKYLEIHSSRLAALPDSFGDLRSLAHLVIRECINLCNLSDGFGKLSRLKHLEIRHSDALTALPDSFGNLSAVERLILDNCELEALPDSFGDLCSLAHLEISGCSSLCNFSDGFGKLSRLKHLEIWGCNALTALPNSFGNLSGLEHLILSMISMKSIPNFIKSLQSLQTLELDQLPFLQDFPSWLGERYGLPLALARKVFHVHAGHFTLASDEENEYAVLMEWIQSLLKKSVEMVEMLDYERALQYLSPYNLGELEPQYQRLLLRERGIVKRLKGDLHGALEDLTRSAGALSEADDGQDSLYEIWKHRGYVNFLLGNLDDAEKDGAMALNLVPEYKCDSLLRQPVFTERSRSSTLGEKSVAYMGFRLGKRLGYKLDKLSELMDSAHSHVMEKVIKCKFKGALACWDLIDTGAYTLPHDVFFLQEKGVLMRLAGDLHGALESLTAALEIYGKLSNVDGYKGEVDYYGYNCSKHRGYVYFLLGDLDRAQYDGGIALKLRHCQLNAEQKPRWALPEFPSDQLEMPSSLGEELVKYMQFTLVGRTDPRHRGRLSSPLYMEEKLSMSDFSGALIIWDAVDGKVSCLSSWFIFLLQRGTLKRLVGDLHGASGDLTIAWEIIGDSEDLTTSYKSLNLPDSLLYEFLKQRGFVNYLLGDLNGAHKYGTMALKDPKFIPVYSEAEDGDRYSYDCWKHRGYVNFLLEAQVDDAKWDGAMVVATGLNQAMNVAGMVSPSVGEESVTYYRAAYGATLQDTESIGAQDLSIISAVHDDGYWRWCHRNGSRHAEVALLQSGGREVNGRWQGRLPPGAYTLSWRLCCGDGEDGHRLGFSFEASGNARITTDCHVTRLGARTSRQLSEGEQQPLGYVWDADTWMELDVGNFTVESTDLPVEITFSMKEIDLMEWKENLYENLYLDGVVICPSWTTHNRISLSTLEDSEIDSDSLTLEDSETDSDSLDSSELDSDSCDDRETDFDEDNQ